MKHKCLASFIVFILFFTVSSLIVFWEIRTIFQADFINSSLRESGIYTKLSDTVDGVMKDSPDTDVETKILVKYIAKVLKPDYTRSEIEKNSQNFFNYLSGKSKNLNVVFDLKPLKSALKSNSLSTPDLENIIKEEVNTLPECPADFEIPRDQIPNCIPQNATKDQFAQGVENTMSVNELLDKMPDSYDVQENLKNNSTLNGIRSLFLVFKFGLLVSLILSILLLGLLALLGRNWWPSILRWTGLSLVLPSGNIIIMNLIGFYIQKSLYSGLDPKIYNSIMPIIDSINKNTIQKSYLISGVIFGIGVILIILSYALPHPPEPKPIVKQPPTSTPTPAPSK